MHPNEELLRKGYAAFESADLDTIRELFAEDAVVHTFGKNPLSGTYKGRDEIFGFLAQLITLAEGTYKISLHEVLANDDHVVALGNVTASRAGRSIAYNQVATYHVRNGQVSEAWYVADDQYAEDEFWNA
jgi:ketosteroid isomerase-like protein